jgi:hypothetical protein
VPIKVQNDEEDQHAQRIKDNGYRKKDKKTKDKRQKLNNNKNMSLRA